MFKNKLKNLNHKNLIKQFSSVIYKNFLFQKLINWHPLILILIAPQLFNLNLAGPALLDKEKVSPFRKISSIKINSLPYELRVACENYEKFESIDLIQPNEIKIPEKCYGKNIDISFKAANIIVKKYHYPYGNLSINFSPKLENKVILTTNLRPSYKAETSSLYSYRLNNKNRFGINIKDSVSGSLIIMANEFCSNFDTRNPLCLTKTKNLKKYKSEFIGLNYILGIYTDAGKSCSNISSQIFFPSYTGVDSVLPKSYENLVAKHIKTPTRILCVHHVDELVEKGIIPSIAFNHSLEKEGFTNNVPVSFALINKDRLNKKLKEYSNIHKKEFTNYNVKFIPGREKSLLISKDPENSKISLFFESVNYERILFTGIPFSNSNLLDLDSYKKFIINEAFLGILIPPNISEIELKSRVQLE